MQNTYGFKFDDLDTLAELLGEILQIRWEPHESHFVGEYFLSGKYPDESLVIKNNYFELEGWSMKKFKAYALLLHVNATTPEKQEALERLFQEKLDMEWKLLKTRE